MRKFILAFICSIVLIMPINSFAKKVTCSVGDYSATVEIDKEKIKINDIAYITVSSETEYKVSYEYSQNGYLEVDSLGVVKALKEGNVTINTKIEFTNAEDNYCKVDLPIEITSSDSSLKKLTLEELDITALFQPDKYEYEIKLPYKYEKINIIAEANNSNAKITGDGRRYLNEGTNEYEVVVTATDGSTSTYKIIINRDEANEEATLDNLIVEGYVLSPKFDKDTYKYALEVDKDVEEITINAKTTYELAKIRGTGTFSLATGKNTYSIIVTAENGNEAEYEIEIIKNKGSSKLKNLVVEGYELDSKFDTDKFIYTLTVNNEVEKIDIKTETIDNDQVEVIGNDELVVGENEIIIRVTGEDKSTTTYKLIVNRLSLEEEKEIEKNDMLLKILFVAFIISIIIMVVVIAIFLKRNYKRTKKIKKIKNIKKGKRK